MNYEFKDNGFTLIAVFLLIEIAFSPSLFTYFAQDDFYLLSISQANSIIDFLNFFLPLKDTVWYRPLSSQIFFWINRLLFGLNPFWWHVVVFVTHFLATYVLYLLVFKIVKSKRIAWLSALFYGTHQIYTVSLSWLATYSFVLGPLIVLLSLLNISNKKYTWSWIFYTFGLLTTEVMLIMPIILVVFFIQLFKQLNKTAFNYATKRKTLKKSALVWLLAFLLPAVVMIIMRLMLFPTAQHTDLYTISLFTGFFASIKFYGFRLLGFPLFFSLLSVPVRIILTLMIVSVLGMVLIGFLLAIQKRSGNLILFAVIGIIGTIPFLFFPFHRSPYYLTFALIGFAPFIVITLDQGVERVFKRARKIGWLLIVFLYISVQLIGIQSTYKYHWIFSRAQLAKELINKSELVHPVGSEEYFALGADRAQTVFSQ